jgi:hypothetical protein
VQTINGPLNQNVSYSSSRVRSQLCGMFSSPAVDQIVSSCCLPQSQQKTHPRFQPQSQKKHTRCQPQSQQKQTTPYPCASEHQQCCS